eukprot:c25444_g3_i2 orf=433-615(+)
MPLCTTEGHHHMHRPVCSQTFVASNPADCTLTDRNTGISSAPSQTTPQQVLSGGNNTSYR